MPMISRAVFICVPRWTNRRMSAMGGKLTFGLMSPRYVAVRKVSADGSGASEPSKAPKQSYLTQRVPLYIDVTRLTPAISDAAHFGDVCEANVGKALSARQLGCEIVKQIGLYARRNPFVYFVAWTSGTQQPRPRLRVSRPVGSRWKGTTGQKRGNQQDHKSPYCAKS